MGHANGLTGLSHSVLETWILADFSGLILIDQCFGDSVLRRFL
jgi:hypothetical protein